MKKKIRIGYSKYHALLDSFAKWQLLHWVVRLKSILFQRVTPQILSWTTQEIETRQKLASPIVQLKYCTTYGNSIELASNN